MPKEATEVVFVWADDIEDVYERIWEGEDVFDTPTRATEHKPIEGGARKLYRVEVAHWATLSEEGVATWH